MRRFPHIFHPLEYRFCISPSYRGSSFVCWGGPLTVPRVEDELHFNTSITLHLLCTMTPTIAFYCRHQTNNTTHRQTHQRVSPACWWFCPADITLTIGYQMLANERQKLRKKKNTYHPSTYTTTHHHTAAVLATGTHQLLGGSVLEGARGDLVLLR